MTAPGTSPSPPPFPAKTGTSLRRIFTGPEGLRSGWGVLCFLLLLTGLGAATYGLVMVLPLPPFESGGTVVMTPFNKGVVDAVLLIIVAISTSIMANVERRRLADYGFQARKAVTRFFTGAGWGFAFISLLVFALLASHHLILEHHPVSGGLAFRYGVEWFISMLFVGAFEETLFRGYLQWTLARGMTFAAASGVLAILFGIAHGLNPGESRIGLVAAAVFGLVFSLSIWYTQSLWWAIGFHTAWNWGMTFFYGTPNSGLLAAGHFLSVKPKGAAFVSGGSTGPEGSILMLPILLLAGIVICTTMRRETSTGRNQSSSRLDSDRTTSRK